MTAISAISCVFLFFILCETSAIALPNSTDLFLSNKNFTDIEAALAAHLDSGKIPKVRRKRYISQNDMIAILDFHNQVRGKVFPPASNMEYMVLHKCNIIDFSGVTLVLHQRKQEKNRAYCSKWYLMQRAQVRDKIDERFQVTLPSGSWQNYRYDHQLDKVRSPWYLFLSNILPNKVWDETLAKSAEAWAATCIWDHGPSYLLRFLGQNLSVRTGRYRSILQLVKPWYDEVKDYVFPYPQDCNPRCPLRCYGPMCTHYTQMVWATSNRIGCAVHTCHNMNVWGSVWRRAVYLVCNYAPKGNWIGEAPYKVGVPCSACPPSYGGACTDNLCFPGITSNYLYWFK